MPDTKPISPGKGSIFISYRRGIDNDSAGRLFDRLVTAFPESRIFRDVDSALELLGLDFHQVLTERVQGCAVLVAVIGRGWIDSVPRLEAETDFVRIELAAALTRPDLRLIPVLVGDVEMPKADDLPEDLRPLVRRGAIRLTNEGYTKAVETVIRAIAQVLGAGEPLTAPLPVARDAGQSPAGEGVAELSRRLTRKVRPPPLPAPPWVARLALAALVLPVSIWTGVSLWLWLATSGVAERAGRLYDSPIPEIARPTGPGTGGGP